jgi:hypothetical protein
MIELLSLLGTSMETVNIHNGNERIFTYILALLLSTT